MSNFEENISLTIADHENRNRKSFEEVGAMIKALSERMEDVRDELQAIRDDIAIYKQNLMEVSNLVEHENVPLQVFEREIRFLKTMIEEFAKQKATQDLRAKVLKLWNFFRK